MKKKHKKRMMMMEQRIAELEQWVAAQPVITYTQGTHVTGDPTRQKWWLYPTTSSPTLT